MMSYSDITISCHEYIIKYILVTKSVTSWHMFNGLMHLTDKCTSFVTHTIGDLL